MTQIYLLIEKIFRTTIIVFAMPIFLIRTLPKVIKESKETGKVNTLVFASEFLNNKNKYYAIGFMNLLIVLWLLFF